MKAFSSVLPGCYIRAGRVNRTLLDKPYVLTQGTVLPFDGLELAKG